MKGRYESETLFRMRAHLKECIGIVNDAHFVSDTHWEDLLSAERAKRSVVVVGLKAHLLHIQQEMNRLDKEFQEITDES